MATPAKPSSSASSNESSEQFTPYISASTLLPEFTPRAVILGALFGIIFGASTVYLGLKVGLTVSASIPIAVLAITVLKAFGKASILENNIVQTTGSAAESIAAGIVFTIPALLILGLDIDITRTSLIAAAGGLLGGIINDSLAAFVNRERTRHAALSRRHGLRRRFSRRRKGRLRRQDRLSRFWCRSCVQIPDVGLQVLERDSGKSLERLSRRARRRRDFA